MANRNNDHDLLLYFKPECPYCKKVLRFIDAADIDVALANIHEEDHLNDLIELAGKKQVPCLKLDGAPMHESDDIIQWLKDNLVEEGKVIDLPEDDGPMYCPLG